MPDVIVIAGPTASGKTALSLAVARRYGGEIVSADSMQVYRGMDIGTAKATPQERSEAVHHMLDVASPEEDYSVARYVTDASRCCDGILGSGHVPVVTGGTGLYIDSLISGRTFSPAKEDPETRRRLDREYDRSGGAYMLRRLAQIDPERAAKLHPSDRRRIVRALEVFELTGETISAHDAATRLLPPRYDAARIVLSFRDRELLYRRINARVDEMVASGLFEEVERLLSSGISASSTALQAIGYKEPALALRGEITREEAVELIKLNSRRYAKRQLTWFNRSRDCLRIFWDDHPDTASGIRHVYDYLDSCGFTAAGSSDSF